MEKSITFVPVNVSTESQKRVGIAKWLYQPDHTQADWQGVTSFMETNGFPTRVPYDRIGHLTFLLNQAGFQVNFQPMPPRDQTR